jgi:hypothetical protein
MMRELEHPHISVLLYFGRVAWVMLLILHTLELNWLIENNSLYLKVGIGF